MANEILILGGRRTVRALFLYPIPEADRITYTDGTGTTQTVIPTPVPLEGEVPELLTDAERAALNAGAGIYERVSFQIDPELTPAENLAAVRELYASKKAAALAKYASRWARYGSRFDAS